MADTGWCNYVPLLLPFAQLGARQCRAPTFFVYVCGGHGHLVCMLCEVLLASYAWILVRAAQDVKHNHEYQQLIYCSSHKL